ncbi:K(+)-transporting ATPase subunit C [Luteolibacter yonseiensis]|uniref:Potassium-transporting ATPase KdpC subunit n=1 Tax=Luteolibacter yonseiensis TaxID=1144680 RepID=A0A934R7C3_9BACT|nr:K(+)-transporting ATPase subunit C [Luteolibacter yonseiensis]MBK1818324.1 K(+)-transporting ATPase subunit C [Luteolibacter yonseiensis]
MKNLFSVIRPAVVSTLVFGVVCCGFYPLAVTGISKLAFAKKADGSLIVDGNGKVVGSELLGQNFSGAGYFHPRPSAAGAAGYDAAGSSGSNLGPTSRKLADQIKERVAAYRATNGLDGNAGVPADAVTASASGLDPHISPANAALQTDRVARARGLPVEKVRELVSANTDRATLGFLGEDGVNVVKLNLALNAISPSAP